MITIFAMVFLMFLPLSSPVSTEGEVLNLKLDYSVTNKQSTYPTRNPTVMLPFRPRSPRLPSLACYTYCRTLTAVFRLLTTRCFRSLDLLPVSRHTPRLPGDAVELMRRIVPVLLT